MRRQCVQRAQTLEKGEETGKEVSSWKQEKRMESTFPWLNPRISAISPLLVHSFLYTIPASENHSCLCSLKLFVHIYSVTPALLLNNAYPILKVAWKTPVIRQTIDLYQTSSSFRASIWLFQTGKMVKGAHGWFLNCRAHVLRKAMSLMTLAAKE